LQRYIALKGKLEMARRTIELKSSASSMTQRDVLVYKDTGSDADMASQDEDGDASDASDDYGEESSEEEIKEIPLDKRRMVDESDADDYGTLVDDSVSSSGESDSSMGPGDAEEGEVVDYGSESDDGDNDNLASSGESMAGGDEDMDSEDLVK
jgi:hypothetical protein